MIQQYFSTNTHKLKHKSAQIRMEEFPLKKECYNIIGCAMEVHNELGFGFLEAVYQEALQIVFEEKNVPYIREMILDVRFRNMVLAKKYVADFLCFNELIVELKAAETLTDKDISQVINYLKATNKKVGLLLNFGTTKLQYKRIIL